MDELEDKLEFSILGDSSLDATTKKAIVAARRGQGQFRRNLEAIESECRMTGVTERSLLIASHIKPWRSCETSAERLDGMNGLLLTPDADRLFDRGYITFLKHGEVEVSPRVDRKDLQRLGFESLAYGKFGLAEVPTLLGNAFLPSQETYLEYHRSEVFVDGR